MGMGIQFFVYEDTALGRTILQEYNVGPDDIDKMKQILNESVRVLQECNPDKCYGWYEHVITDLPPGAPFQ